LEDSAPATPTGRSDANCEREFGQRPFSCGNAPSPCRRSMSEASVVVLRLSPIPRVCISPSLSHRIACATNALDECTRTNYSENIVLFVSNVRSDVEKQDHVYAQRKGLGLASTGSLLCYIGARSNDPLGQYISLNWRF